MPRRRSHAIDPTILEAALAGLELRRERLNAQIAEVRRTLGGRGPRRAAAVPAAGRKRRRLSAAARKSIATAQKKRWAEWRKRQRAGA